MAEAWTWIAHYRDGSSVGEAALKTFTAVDLASCVAVELVPRRWARQVVRVVVEPDRGQRAVCFRRRALVVSLDGQRPTKGGGTVTVIGWETETAGSYVFALDSGRIVVSANPREM